MARNILLPYPNEHSCRLKDPALFKTCRRTIRESDGKEYSVLTCQYKKRPEGKSDWAEQAYRYDKEIWTVQAAKNHCDLKEGDFEPAATELIDLTVVGSKTLPVDERYEWDGDAAVERMRKFASSDGSGDKDKINWESYKRGFLFRSEDVKNFGSYKLPFCDVINGRLRATWGGVSTAMAALMGARTPIDIPDRYKRDCYNVLAVYYKKLDKDLPEFHLVEGNELLKEFRFGFLIPRDIRLSKKHLIDIEILREGKWTHPEAPDGVLEIEKSDLDVFQKNFEDAVVGDRLPVDLEHKPEKGHAIGWILKLWQTLKNGSWHLWAKIDVTDEQAQENLKNGSLRYISPQLL
ncbi:phage protease, partial [Patescibacteria group bacterium]|nr:phage protease [Patescibacteria group bacterium]